MSKLTEVHRIRLSVESVENLNKLKPNKSKFIRDAEKIAREVPKLIANQIRKQNLKKCPF
jgi:hypothetical protein